MSFKIVPWLLVLSITLAYAFPAEQNNDEDDPNHVHDEHCTHPIKEAFKKVKDGISNAYQKTKQSIGDAYNNLKNKFKKPETEKPEVPPSSQGKEGTELSGGDNIGLVNVDPPRNGGNSFNTGSTGVVGDNNGGSGNIGDSTDTFNSNSNSPQRPPTESEVEQIINVRIKPASSTN